LISDTNWNYCMLFRSVLVNMLVTWSSESTDLNRAKLAYTCKLQLSKSNFWVLCFVRWAKSDVKKYDFNHVPMVDHICIIWCKKWTFIYGGIWVN